MALFLFVFIPKKFLGKVACGFSVIEVSFFKYSQMLIKTLNNSTITEPTTKNLLSAYRNIFSWVNPLPFNQSFVTKYILTFLIAKHMIL